MASEWDKRFPLLSGGSKGVSVSNSSASTGVVKMLRAATPQAGPPPGSPVRVVRARLRGAEEEDDERVPPTTAGTIPDFNAKALLNGSVPNLFRAKKVAADSRAKPVASPTKPVKSMTVGMDLGVKSLDQILEEERQPKRALASPQASPSASGMIKMESATSRLHQRLQHLDINERWGIMACWLDKYSDDADARRMATTAHLVWQEVQKATAKRPSPNDLSCAMAFMLMEQLLHLLARCQPALKDVAQFVRDNIMACVFVSAPSMLDSSFFYLEGPDDTASQEKLIERFHRKTYFQATREIVNKMSNSNLRYETSERIKDKQMKLLDRVINFWQRYVMRRLLLAWKGHVDHVCRMRESTNAHVKVLRERDELEERLAVESAKNTDVDAIVEAATAALRAEVQQLKKRVENEVAKNRGLEEEITALQKEVILIKASDSESNLTDKITALTADLEKMTVAAAENDAAAKMKPTLESALDKANAELEEFRKTCAEMAKRLECPKLESRLERNKSAAASQFLVGWITDVNAAQRTSKPPPEESTLAKSTSFLAEQTAQNPFPRLSLGGAAEAMCELFGVSNAPTRAERCRDLHKKLKRLAEALDLVLPTVEELVEGAPRPIAVLLWSMYTCRGTLQERFGWASVTDSSKQSETHSPSAWRDEFGRQWGRLTTFNMLMGNWLLSDGEDTSSVNPAAAPPPVTNTDEAAEPQPDEPADAPPPAVTEETTLSESLSVQPDPPHAERSTA